MTTTKKSRESIKQDLLDLNRSLNARYERAKRQGKEDRALRLGKHLDASADAIRILEDGGTRLDVEREHPGILDF